MMNIASVIVDVPARQTDKTFDYLIPEHYKGSILPGMRVIVPFGPRRVQGFVVALKENSEFENLKEISEPMDLYPVLTKELLDLGVWLSETTLCYMISGYQAMLPAALKAKYEKRIIIPENVEIEELPFTLQLSFNGNREMTWEEASKHEILTEILHQAAEHKVDVIYEVKESIRKKKVKQILPLYTLEKMKLVKESLPIRASKQHEILDFFIENREPIELKALLSKLKTSSSTVKELVNKRILKEVEVEVYRDPYQDKQFKQTAPLPLTEGQQKVIQPIQMSIKDNQHHVFLLYGVTGSGKTEVYLQSIQTVLENGKEAIVLVPEISLTPQMVHRFKGRFGDKVAVLHSGLSAGEKYDEWRKIHRKEVTVVVGARSAIFAPFENIGIIIIDEEHETSYKQEDTPRYHARDVAIKRAQHFKCPVILGSATPSLESFARAKKEVYQLLTLPNRMNNQALPSVEVIDMRDELRNGNRSMFSSTLFEKIKDRISKGEQIVLFLNKRGHSSFVMCRDCGYVVLCPHCDISLTYHQSQQKMKCHYCGHEEHIPNNCPECKGEHIRYFGTGTQKVEEELGKVLPEARVIRMDVDTTSRKGSHEKLLEAFQEGKADILLGTQMIAKGLDFPNITLVGVLSADTMLNLPDFRSSEKTFQLLTQVSGRAGRHELPGEVVIQTYSPGHYSIELSALQDYDQFYNQEMLVRKTHHYPPFYYLTLITVTHEELLKVVSITEKISAYLRTKLSEKAIVLGPVASAIPRINNRYRYQCLIKYKHEPVLANALKIILNQYQQEMTSSGLQISIDLNPFILM
jgi:primosomal protein N' (replication factor Y) (superfamily II helicase)